MLQLDPLFTVNRVTVFGDHASENQLYYLPEMVRISTDQEGKPQFTLMKYMRDVTDNPAFQEGQQLGGGFCIFTVDCSLDEDTQRMILREARRQGIANPRLASAPFREGEVRLVGLDANTELVDGQVRFVENVQGTSIPSFFGDLRATFSIRLSQEAVELVEQAFERGGQPFGVVYDLKFLGLRPAFDVTVKADYKRIYNEFSANLGAQYMMLRAEIEAGFQKLEEDDAIEITVNTFTDDADARKQRDEALKYFKEDLLKDFFKPSLPLPTDNQSNILSGLTDALRLPQMAGRSLSQARSGTTPIPTPSIPVGQRLGEQPVSPPTTSNGPTDETNPAALRAGETNTSAGLPTAPRSAPPASPATTPQQSGAPESSGGILDNMAVGFKLSFKRQEELRTFTAHWKESSAVERTHAPNGTFGLLLADLDRSQHFMEVDLDSTFFQRLKVDVESPTPFAPLGITEVKAHLEYGDRGDGQPRHVDDLELKPDEAGKVTPQIFTCSLDAAKNLHYQYRLDFFFDPNSPIRGAKTHYTTEMIPTFDRTLTIEPGKFIGFLKVEATVGELDFEEIARIQVKFGYEDVNNDFRVEDTAILKADAESFTWNVRLSNPDHKEYWYEVTYFLKDDKRIVAPRQTSTSGSLVINEPWKDRINVQLDVIWTENISRVVAEFEYHDEEADYRFGLVKRVAKEEDSFSTVPIPILNPDQKDYQYRITIVGKDGTVRRGEPVITSESYLPIQALSS